MRLWMKRRREYTSHTFVPGSPGSPTPFPTIVLGSPLFQKSGLTYESCVEVEKTTKITLEFTAPFETSSPTMFRQYLKFLATKQSIKKSQQLLKTGYSTYKVGNSNSWGTNTISDDDEIATMCNLADSPFWRK